MLAAQRCTTINSRGAEILAMLQNIAAGPPDNPPQLEDIPNLAANAMVQDNIQLQMLTILQVIQANNFNAGRGVRGGRGGRGRSYRGIRNRRTQDNVTFQRQITSEYCHTQGGYNYTSGDCTRPATGHNNAAAMINRLKDKMYIARQSKNDNGR